MKKLCLLFIILLVVGGCSEKEEIGQLTNKYEKQLDVNQKVIQEQQKAIKDLKDEIETYKLVPPTDYRTSLQETDREARNIIRLISEGKFEELKREYSVEFEIKDDAIDFGVPQNNQPFPIELASNYMYITNFIIGTNRMDISYFISSPDSDRYELIHMSFEKNMKFKYIFVGDA